MKDALLTLIIPLAVVAWFCISIKVGFMVGDATKNSGFDVGFYMITVVAMISTPIALYVGITS